MSCVLRRFHGWYLTTSANLQLDIHAQCYRNIGKLWKFHLGRLELARSTNYLCESWVRGVEKRSCVLHQGPEVMG